MGLRGCLTRLGLFIPNIFQECSSSNPVTLIGFPPAWWTHVCLRHDDIDTEAVICVRGMFVDEDNL